jgi:predicted nucleotidyltransferase
MISANLEKLPERAQKVLKPYVKKLLEIYESDVLSIFAYGSVTSMDYEPRTSDINIAVVMKDLPVHKLKRSLGLVRSGRRKGITAPLFLTPEYVRMSLDAFPIEFMNMKDTRLVLLGGDVLADITVNEEDLRKECEYYLKGKLIALRQAYLERALNLRSLEGLLKAALKSLIPVFRNMLRIKTKMSPPVYKAEILKGISETFGIDMESFQKVFEASRAKRYMGKRTAEEAISSFVDGLAKLSLMVDKI